MKEILLNWTSRDGVGLVDEMGNPTWGVWLSNTFGLLAEHHDVACANCGRIHQFVIANNRRICPSIIVRNDDAGSSAK